MTAPGNYPPIHTGGLAVIPIEHQTLLMAGLREKERGSCGGAGTGPYKSWPNQGTIVITNPVATASYPHYILLPWLPGMQPDFRDIRFAQQDGTVCPYWIETYTAGSSASVWFKNPSASQRQVSLFYGNPQAVSESSGSAVFDFFDDFAGASLDTSKWNNITGSGVSVSGGVCTIAAASDAVYGISTKSTITPPFVLEARVKPTHLSTYLETVQPKYIDASNQCTVYFCHISSGDNNMFYTHSGAGVEKTAIDGEAAGEYNRVTSWVLASSIKYQMKSPTGGTGTVVTHTTKYPSGNGYSRVTAYRNGSVIYIDWIAIRKYTATEPTCALTQYGPRPDAQIIYYPFLPAPLAALPGGNVFEELIEFGCTYAMDTPIVQLRPGVNFGVTYQMATPTIHKDLAAIAFEVDYRVKLFAKVFLDLDRVDLDEEGVSISRGVQDSLWKFSAGIDAFHDLDLSVMRHVTFTTTDHNDVPRTLFTGMLPASTPELGPAAEKTQITGYDYAWYLTQQPVPDAYQHNTATANPATVIDAMLGGNDWMNTTGIEPYRINNVDEWGVTLASRVFDFARMVMIWTAIQRYCDYCRYVFLVKWRLIGPFLYPAAYFCHEDDIDDPTLGLDLPAPVTFANPSPYLSEDSIKIQNQNDEKFNRVIVIGRASDGSVYFGTEETADVTNGDELPVTYIENSGAFTTQVQVDARAVELLAYYSVVSRTYRCRILDRVDLEYLQKIQFTGYTGIPEDWMRITWINYDVGAGKKMVEIEFTADQKLSSIKRMYRCMTPDDVSETEAIFDSKMGNVAGNEIGVVTTINDDGTEATITLEDGRTVTARIG